MPTLSIDIEARFAKFQDGLDKIDRDVSRSVKGMSRSFDTLKSAARGLVLTLVGFGAVRAFKGLIDDLDQLQTISEKTGRSAQSLVGFALAAKTTGTDLESFAKGLNKLNIALSGLASGKNAEIKDLLLQMGLGEFAKGAIDAEEALLQLAAVFPRLSDADKARVALTFFGKAGQDLIPALNGGRESLEKFIKQGEKAFPNANKLAKDADEFKDSMDELSLVLKGSLLDALNAVLPLMKSLSKAMANIDPDGGVASFAKGIAEVFKVVIVLGANVAYVFTTIGKEIGGFAQQLKALAKFDFKTIKIIADEMKAQGVEGRKAIDAFTKDILFPEGPKQAKTLAPRKPELTLRGNADTEKKTRAKAERDDSAQRLLDQQLKAFERSIDEERDLAASRNEFLDRFYAQGLVSLGDYTAKKKAYLDESVQAQTEAINGEIALLAKSRSKQPADDRIATDTKINELIAKRITLQNDANLESLKLFLDSRDAAKETAEGYQQINIELLEMQGRFEEAARARFDLDNAGRLTKLTTDATSKSNTPEDRAAAEHAKRQIIAMGDLNIEMERFNVLAKESNTLRQDAADAEDRIQLAIENGTLNEIEGLNQIGAVRSELSAQLERNALLMRDIAEVAKDPALVQWAKDAKIEVEKLNGSLSPLRDQFEGMAANSIAGFFQDISSGTVSAKQAFKNMISGFVSDLANFYARAAAKQLATKLFTSFLGAAGGGTGAGATVQTSAGGYAEGGQVTGAGSTVSDSIPVLLSNKEFVVRAKPVQEPGALAFLTRFNKMGMKALQRFSMGGLVGAMAGTSSASLVMAGAGVNLTQQFTVPQSTPRETQQQIASAAYQGSMRAYRRNR